MTSGATAAQRDRLRIAVLVFVAIALRLLMFTGRGDYVAFDEGWYLLLGRSLVAGRGYSLSGLTHTVLSPLFPLLAGAVDLVLRNAVWAGRVVAAVSAGMLVWPCWHLFRRFTSRRTAWVACLLVVAMPALAPFVVPFWIGWDLWVGAEPLSHLLLFTGLALALRAYDSDRMRDWLVAGVAFSLAYLARPEAIITLGLLGLLVGIRAVLTRRPLRVAHAAVLGLAFALTATPYWLYLHDVTGRWTITGRGLELAPRRVAVAAAPPAESGPAATIEQMLWSRDQSRYVENLYALDSSGTRLASTYWGVNPRGAIRDMVPARPMSAPSSAPTPGTDSPRDAGATPARPPESTLEESAPEQLQSRIALYLRALSRVIPLYLWPFVLLGVIGARPRWRKELMVVLPVVGTSVAIARIVAIDPRTQLILAPLAAFYAARGLRQSAVYIHRRWRSRAVRRSFVFATVSGVMLALLLGTQARRLYLSLALGSPHHVVGTENRRVGEALQRHLPPDATVTSWHPALALYARRDWRVLPHAPFLDIVRYADATNARYLVISPYYPGPRLLDPESRDHILLPVPPGAAAVPQWHLELNRSTQPFLLGTLRPAAATAAHR